MHCLPACLLCDLCCVLSPVPCDSLQQISPAGIPQPPPFQRLDQGFRQHSSINSSFKNRQKAPSKSDCVISSSLDSCALLHVCFCACVLFPRVGHSCALGACQGARWAELSILPASPYCPGQHLGHMDHSGPARSTIAPIAPTSTHNSTLKNLRAAKGQHRSTAYGSPTASRSQACIRAYGSPTALRSRT